MVCSAVAGTLLAPAKVNLTLRVVGRRPDGYHELESLVAFASIGDRLHVVSDGRVPLDRVDGPTARDLVGRNLVETAFVALRRAAPNVVLPSVALEKRLPVSGGVGGGSADAAAYVRLTRDTNPGLDGRVDWLRVAASVGADVPVCLRSQPVMMSGVGERLHPVPWLENLPAVLVNPQCVVPATKTRDVFGRLAASPAPAHQREFIQGERTTLEDVSRLIALGTNDLANAACALMPEINIVRDALEATRDVQVVRLSGAGPTMFGLYRDDRAAFIAAEEIARQQPDWWVVSTTIGAPPLTENSTRSVG